MATLSEPHLIHSFNALRNAIDQFINQLCNEKNRPAWVFNIEGEEWQSTAAREQLANILKQLEFIDDQDGRETIICPGIIGASGSTIRAAFSLNKARDRFKNAVLTVNESDKERAHTIMTKIGFARIHFKQIYRHLPILLKKPHSIRYTWGTTRSIKKISREEARKKLLEIDSTANPGIFRQLEALENLPHDEPLAVVQDLKPHIKANLTWVKQTEPGKITRKMISAALPILIPLDPDAQLPIHAASFPKDTAFKRKRRSDVKIEPIPFLPSIRAHRYMRNTT